LLWPYRSFYISVVGANEISKPKNRGESDENILVGAQTASGRNLIKISTVNKRLDEPTNTKNV
jgi:hypothetical protein